MTRLDLSDRLIKETAFAPLLEMQDTSKNPEIPLDPGEDSKQFEYILETPLGGK